MEVVLIDNELLKVALPKGFVPIEHQELELLMGLKYAHMWGARNQNRHMLVHVTWKDSGKLLTKFVNEKSLAKQVDQKFARSRASGGYRNDGFFECVIAGADAPAQGFRFSYMVKDVGQCGEVMVFKHGKRCYTLTYYTRSQSAARNRSTYEGILASLGLERG